MIRKVISKYGLAAHLGLLAALPVALYPFVDVPVLGRVVLFAAAFAALWIFAEPSVRLGERSFQTRSRVMGSIFGDPLFYFFLAVVLFALIRWINSGICLWYDAEQSVWQLKEPSATVMPASAGTSGYLPFVASVGIWVFVVGVRNALGLSARVFCGLTVVAVVGVGGLVAAVCACLGVLPTLAPAVKCSIATSPFLGTAFGYFLILSVVFGVDAECRKWVAARLPFVVAVAGTSSGLVFFAPPYVAAVFVVVALLFLIFSSVYSARLGSMGGVARGIVFFLLGLVVPALLLMALAPVEIQQFKLEGLNPQNFFPVEYGPLNEIFTRVSKGMWLERPWLGTGVGAYGLQVPFLAEKADWSLLPTQVKLALNGYWTLLAERGIIGCALLVVGLGLLLCFWVSRLAEAFSFLRGNDEADVFPFACPPVVWTAPFILLLGLAELYFSPAFSSIASVFALIVPLVLSAASFPRNPKKPVVETVSSQPNEDK